MPTDPKRVKEIFLGAAEQADETARVAYLDHTCGGDAGLRERVEALLRSHDPAGSFLDSPAAEVPAPDDFGTIALPEGGSPRLEADHMSDGLQFLTPSTRPDSLGRIGHYEVLQVLGKGGFGIVFRAFDETLQRVVALKMLSPQMAATSPARKRFLREARSSAKVRHENVVQVYAVEEQPLPHLVMEFIPGETLQQRLDRTGPLETAEVLRIGRQIAEGLAAAHCTGLIHRDIKPANILIDAGPSQNVKITDFGLARAADDASLTQSGLIAGTPMYMAPEQARGEALDHRADLFSLGSVLYTMSSGRPPFRANSTLAVLKRVAEDAPRPIPEIIPEVPQWLCDIIARLHAKQPEDRIGTAREVADLLGLGLAAMQRPGHVPPPVVAKMPQPQENPGDAPTIRRPRFRASRWATAAAVLLLLGGLGLTDATGVTNVGGTVIRLFSPEGTLIVEVDDPGVSVKIDGSEFVITGAGAKEIRLKPGNYTVEASKDGKVVRQQLVTVTKNGKQVVRVSREVPPETKTAKEKSIGAPTDDPDRRAADYVLSIGGKVRVNGSGRDLEAAADLPLVSFRLTAVFFNSNKQVSDAGLSAFKDCKNLTDLGLGVTQVSDVGLAFFKDCKNLKHLALNDTQVSNAGLGIFEDCKNLTFLFLEDTKVSDEGLAHFKGRNLGVLVLSRTQVSNAGLANFKDCKNLYWLWLSGTNVSDAGLVHFKDRNLVYLDLSNTKVTNAGLANFKDCKNLKDLIMNDTQVSDEGLAYFEGCRDLSQVNLANTQVGDASLAFFEDCKNLSLLQLQKTKVTAAGFAELKKALPKCKIEEDGALIEPQ